MLIKLYDSQKVRVTNSEILYKILRDIHFSQDKFDTEKEFFYCVMLNRMNDIRFIDIVSIGNLTGTVVSVREIFRHAIVKGAYSVVIAHNHPSGNTSPSDADRQVVKQIAEAGKIIGIRVMDSLIITEKSYYSFSDEGMMDY